MLVKTLPPELRKDLHALAIPLRGERGQVLFRAGEPGRGAFLIRSGKVRLTLELGQGMYPTRRVGSGAMIGLPATFSGEPYSLTAEVEKTCRMDFIPRSKLRNFLLRNPKAGFQVVRILSEEIFQMRNSAKRSMHTTAPTTQKAN